MTREDFLRLLRFYLACIEAEDRRSLTKKLSAIHHSLVSPWETGEPLFHPEATEVVLEVTMSSDRQVLTRGAALAGGSDRFFYGYPIYLDEDGFISPLFVAEVEIERQGDSSFILRPVEAGEIQVNHHLFRRQHTQPEELLAIEKELSGEFGSFTDRLRAAFELLGASAPNCPASPLEPYPSDDSPRKCWINRPILFKSERSSYTQHLRRELEALIEYSRLNRRLEETAIGILAGIGSPTMERSAGQALPPLLQVLPLNSSQEKAARSAMEMPLTVITGPPGTGKSQVVVDLLASCAMAGRPVLFASKNNKAVDVVRARLRAILGEDWDWILRLGSRRVMDEFKQEMEQRLDNLRAEAVLPPVASDVIRELDEQIDAVRRQVEELERTRAQYTRLDRDRRVYESRVDPTWVKSWKHGDPSPDLATVVQLTATAEAAAGHRPAGIWLKLMRALFPGILYRSLREKFESVAEFLPENIRRDMFGSVDATYNNAYSPGAFEDFSSACRKLANLARWCSAENECARVLSMLCEKDKGSDLAEKIESLQHRRGELACQQFRYAWTSRVAQRISSVRYKLSRYFELSSRLRQSRDSTFSEILEQLTQTIRTLSTDLPIWIVTNLSVRNAVPLEPAVFDLVIIDEASQCDIPSSLPLLFRARRALIIGDPRQLRHISTLSPSEEDSLANEYEVVEHIAMWSYNQRSLYSLAEEAIRNAGGEPVFLAEHYRSHPEIIEFSNRTFYNGRLVLRTKLDSLQQRLRGEPLGVFWHNVSGEVPTLSRSAMNPIEIQAVLGLLDKWADSGFLFKEDINFGIVTPFRLQMERLEEAIQTRTWWEKVGERLVVGTAHRFQGDERDVMIFSPVVSSNMHPRLVKWVAETDQLLNVAITRARAALHVVGDLQACIDAGGFLREFALTIQDGLGSHATAWDFESPAEMRMAELLKEVGLWFFPQYWLGRYRLDFLVITPFGTRYDVEVDGRGHLTDEAVRSDEVRDAALAAQGLKVLRIDARRLFRNDDEVREILQRLV